MLSAMTRQVWIGLCLINSLVAAQDQGWKEAAGVNLTLEEGFGARHSGMGITFAGFQTDANAAANAPAGMNDLNDFTLSTAHAERFGEAKFDDFALLVPFEARSTLGLGIARYGVSDVETRDDVDPVGNRGDPDGYFTVADYLVTTAFARRWGGLDLGASLHLLYRQLDQNGVGMRADAMAQYTFQDRYRISALLKGLAPSAAAWESDWREYEPTDLHVGIAARIPAPYFYGTLQAAWQSEGLFQMRAKSASDAYGSRFYSNPLKTLQAGNVGLEFLFDFGLTARIGITELLYASEIPSNLAFGVGYVWRRTLGVDYSFAPHPDLLASHRISLQFTPDFPRFTG
ncbi:MAG TPA: hypothetical protein VK465_03250, partial [Fibrobacteria bacterium]|nr:hypothetical protein [Fibrobacteria bacterium]